MLAIATVVALVGLIAYAACTKHDDESKMTVGTDLQALTQVVAPDDHIGIMLHYKGFDINFNPNHHQPNYAAWVLTREMVENANTPRKDKFRADPDVEGSATPADYRQSGYDRGHIVPAGDMRWDAEAMDASFFMTNISPQATKLNTGPWKSLEESTRTWAARDSAIVIIAGPVLSDRLSRTIGTTPVTVPDRFFKVILAPYANPPRAIGFVMNNGTNQGGVQATVMTVDQVEAITGYDFFSALPDEIENTVEAEARFSTWQYTR